MITKKIIAIGVVVFLAGLGAGYGFGQRAGYQKGDDAGYKRAEADIKSLEGGASKKATAEAAKAANPFQAVNPLQGVDTNPFEKAKKILNPF